MRKVVVLTSRFPMPLNKGDKLRIFHHIREIAKVAEVHLICLYADEPEQSDWTEVRSICKKVYAYELSSRRRKWNALRYFAKGYPLQIGYFYDEHVCKRINWLLETLRPDHIHCHLVRMSPYVLAYKKCTKSIDYMDSLVLNDMAGQHLGFFPASIFRNTERNRIKQFERRSHANFDTHFVISERDSGYFKEDVKADIKLLPNGVQVDQPDTSLPKDYDICFCGNLGYPHNVKAIRILAKHILPKLDNVTCIIAGAEAPSSILELENIMLKITSPVDDMSRIYQKSKIQVTPIFSGSGQQNKILEAMAIGIPNVTSEFVNQSIGARDGQEIIVCKSVDDFVTCINELLSQPKLCADISKKANNFVKRNFDWSVNTLPLIEAITND